MTQDFKWLRDQSRYDEVINWLGGRWQIDQLEAWSSGRFTLDDLKTWTKGKYTLDEIVKWTYHESDETADFASGVIDTYRSDIEKHQGTISFLGIDANFNVHIAFDGACGSCTLRETSTMENLRADLAEYVPGFRGLINDGPSRPATGNYAINAFSPNNDAPVEIRTLGLAPIARVTQGQ